VQALAQMRARRLAARHEPRVFLAGESICLRMLAIRLISKPHPIVCSGLRSPAPRHAGGGLRERIACAVGGANARPGTALPPQGARSSQLLVNSRAWRRAPSSVRAARNAV